MNQILGILKMSGFALLTTTYYWYLAYKINAMCNFFMPGELGIQKTSLDTCLRGNDVFSDVQKKLHMA